MANHLIVGYSLKPIPDLDSLVPDFKEHPEDKREGLKESWKLAAESYPYTGTFDAVVIADPANRRIGQWSSKERAPGSKKVPVCVAIRRWLLKGYPDAWTTDLAADPQPPRVLFLGFEVAGFLRMLGIECSLSGNEPLPASLWLGPSAARGCVDMGEACFPEGSRGRLTWGLMFARRNIVPKAGWRVPGEDPDEDARLAAELAGQLGFKSG